MLVDILNYPESPGGNIHLIQSGYIDGPGDVVARATLGCVAGGNCSVIFGAVEALPWDTTTDVRGDNQWLDVHGTAAHEFGHWAGLAHSTDQPVTDGGAMPTMWSWGAAKTWARTIQADDHTALRSARPYPTANIAANGSFEWSQAAWGGHSATGWLYRSSGGSGSAARYGTGGSSGSWFFEYNNSAPGSSMYQDIANWQGYAGANPPTWWNRSSPEKRLQFRAYVKSPQFNSSATVAVWALDTGVLLASSTCNLASGAGYIECVAPWFTHPDNNTWLRLEVYNNAAYTNLRIDNVKLVVEGAY